MSEIVERIRVQLEDQDKSIQQMHSNIATTKLSQTVEEVSYYLSPSSSSECIQVISKTNPQKCALPIYHILSSQGSILFFVFFSKFKNSALQPSKFPSKVLYVMLINIIQVNQNILIN